MMVNRLRSLLPVIGFVVAFAAVSLMITNSS